MLKLRATELGPLGRAAVGPTPTRLISPLSVSHVMIAPEPKLIRRANGATIAATMAITRHATSNDFRLNCSITRIVLSLRSGVSAVKL